MNDDYGNPMVRCGKEFKWARAALACVHVINDPTLKDFNEEFWREVDENPEEIPAFYCEECEEKEPDSKEVIDASQSLCLSCAREMFKVYDNPLPDEDL